MFKKLFIFLSFFFFSAVPAFATCTSVATPDTVPANSSTPISIAVSNIDPEQPLVGFACDALYSLTTDNGCTVSNFSNISGYSLTTDNSTYGNWIGTGTSNLTVGANFLFTSTGDKTFDVYGADNNNGDNQITCPVTIHVVAATPTPTPTPTPSCTSVATPDTVQVNTNTPVSIAVTNINPVKPLVGFACDALYKLTTDNGCTLSNFSTISGYSLTSLNPTYGNWINNDGLGTSNLTVGANFLFTSTGDKTFDVYGADNNNGDNQITCPVTMHVFAPPTVNAITVSTNPVQVNTATTASANFTDSETGTHTASWNWGDGNTTTGTVTEPNGSNPGSISDSHTYTSAGVYTITLTVTNTTNGATGTSQYQYVSVYNPTAQGLFSAGHKFTSPAGAYAANTSLTGNVKFGLSYKYQGSVPTGSRQFSMDFNTANFHFNATSVNSLVIANGMGTLTGTGTVNGSGTYNFLVTGSESANTIRIQVKDSSGNVIYDTQPGAADTATPTTSVTGNVLAH